MLQLIQVAPDRIGLSPRHGQNVDVARIALAGQSSLDADEQRLFLLAVVVAIGSHPLQVIANHAFAKAGPLADLSSPGKATPLSVARPASHNSTSLRAGGSLRSQTQP
jgi:hypothetical protein